VRAVTTRAIDVAAVAPPGVEQCTVDVFLPPDPTRASAIAVCVPGGYSSRRYFDLAVAPEHGEYSMARHLAGHGMLVIIVDPPGVGDSDVPDDPFTLTPDTLADVLASLTETVVEAAREGRLLPGTDPVGPAPVLGVGHSAGALLTVYAQARHGSFDALALLGFSGRGLPEQLGPAELACAGDPAAARAALPDLVRSRFASALPPFPARPGSIFAGGPEPEVAKAALRQARAPLLALLGMTSMIPGASAPELAAITVPVLLGIGERDITGEPRAVPAHFPAATDITLFVLAGAGHAHNIAARRAELWDRIVRWAGSLPGALGS